MISFCQDLHVSHEYHIYEGKTVKKKVTHFRNNSALEQRVLDKSQKLQLTPRAKHPSQSNRSYGLNISNRNKDVPGHLKTMDSRYKSFSHKSVRAPKEKFCNQGAQHYGALQASQHVTFESIKKFQSMQFDESDPQPTHRKPAKVHNFFEQADVSPVIRFSHKDKPPSTISSEQKTIKIHGEQCDLNSSIETKNLTGKKSGIKPISTPRRLHQRTLSHLAPELSADHPERFNAELHSDFLSKNGSQCDPISQNFEHVSLQKAKTPILQTFNKDILYDAQSIVSKTLESEQISDSVIEKSEFSFVDNKAEMQGATLRKTIDNYMQSGPCKQADNQGWIAYPVFDKITYKDYSIKQFSQFHQKQFMDELSVCQHLEKQQGSLKAERPLLNLKHNGGKYVILKEPIFAFLDDHLCQDAKESLEIEQIIASIEFIIRSIFIENRMRIKSEYQLELSDFVICPDRRIKLHSSFKLETIFSREGDRKMPDVRFVKNKNRDHKSGLCPSETACSEVCQSLKTKILEQQFHHT